MIKNCASIEEMKMIYDNWFKINYKPSSIDFSYNIKKMIENIQTRSKKTGFKNELLKEDFIVPEFCPILNIKIIQGIIKGAGKRVDSSPSIDRIDNSKGYTKDNIRIISWRANKLKGIATYEEYQKIYEFYSNLAKNK